MRHLLDQLHHLEHRLRQGSGPARIDKQHQAGKLTARERFAADVEEIVRNRKPRNLPTGD
jgi:acetyl-CoA carboxylase carboxyltransferase component